MNEPSKQPFEPIPMPEMPALPEMPRPSFSRTSTPPAPPPLPRRPLLMDDDKPNPFLLPQGIASEEPAPTPPVPAPAPGGWLRPSRAKGVIFAGLASLGIGAFGLNALFPVPVNEPQKAGSMAQVELPPLGRGFGESAPTPKVLEERPAPETPGLMPKVVIEKNEEEWNKPLPIVQVDSNTPITVPTTIPTVPLIVPSTPAVPLFVPNTDPLPVPLPTADPLPKPALPGLDDEPKPMKPLPATPAPLPEVKLDPTAPKVVLLPVPNFTANPEPKPPAILSAPETRVPPVMPVAVPELKLAAPNIELKPWPEHKTEPLPLPVPRELPKSIAPATVEAKTAHDDDIHKLRSGDSYSAISQKFYGSAAYATALRGYNDNAELTGLSDVQVPPIHIIKRFTATPKVVPVGLMQDPGMVAPPPVENSVEWGSPGARKSDKPKSGDPVWR